MPWREVDARFTLAFWTLALLDTGPRLGAGRSWRSSLSSGWRGNADDLELELLEAVARRLQEPTAATVNVKMVDGQTLQ
jgi:hypothetical protein